MKTNRAFALGVIGDSGAMVGAPELGVVASLIGAMLCFTATAASAREPLNLADTQLEPVKWTELEGWTADDHLAAFATYQTSCQACAKNSAPTIMDRSMVLCGTSAAKP